VLDPQITYILNIEKHNGDAALENLNFKFIRPDLKYAIISAEVYI